MPKVTFPAGASRRSVLKGMGAAGAGLMLPVRAFAAGHSGAMRPQMPSGVMSGDVTGNSAIVWSHTDRPAQMIVEYAFDESMKDLHRVEGGHALPETGYTARVDLSDLPSGEPVFYRVSFRDMHDYDVMSEPVAGTFRTAPAGNSDVYFGWGGDTCGQGWGINPDFGGMKTFGTMAGERFDFFINSGDYIYADGALKEEVDLPDGTKWKNIVIPEKAKVAETLDEYRGNYRYNLMDEHYRAFNAVTPVFAQWDDHETTNNWYHQRRLDGDDRYAEKSVAMLAARAKRAFLEFTPVRPAGPALDNIHRRIPYGPRLDVFMIDMRSYRSANNDGLQEQPGDDTHLLGAQQVAWLKQQLLASKATWKVIAADMPLGLIVWHNFKDRKGSEAVSQGDMGLPKGREHEIASLLKFIKDNRIENVVWLTADVHYAAAHWYEPEKAQFKDFNGFWEFVSGPLHAGTFGPNEMGATFGPQEVFVSRPKDSPANTSPAAGEQWYGAVKIDGRTGLMTVQLKDMTGKVVHSTDIEPKTA